MKKLFLMAPVFFMTALIAFAQIDPNTAPIEKKGAGNNDMEASLGFQLTITKEQNTARALGPGIALSWRQYFEPISDKIDFGYSIAADISFITERDWKVPGSLPPFDFNNKTYNKGDILHMTWAEADYIMNLSLVVGPGIRGKIASGFGYAADVGIGINIDLASWKSFQASENKNLYLDLRALNLGVNLGGAFQYRLDINATQLVFELGANMGYYFSRFNSVDLYWADRNNPGKDRTKIGSLSRAFEAVNIFRMGAPYFVMGWAF